MACLSEQSGRTGFADKVQLVSDIHKLATSNLRMAKAAPFDAIGRCDLWVSLHLRIDGIHDVAKEIGFIGLVRRAG